MANTNKGRKVYICVTAQPTDLDQTGYEALIWTRVKHVGSVGESGTKTNINSYDELETDVTQKSKGISNAGDPVIECARNPTDAGQVALRAAALTHFVYAFKFEDADAPASDYTNTVYYNRGLVAGPERPNGKNEDFILERFTLGLVQKEIVVDPEPQSVPVNVTVPSITGSSLAQGATLAAVVGTWTNDPTSYTYQWQHDADGNGTYANISSATNSILIIAAGQAGDSIRVQVTAVNSAGSSSAANSLGTALAGS